MNDLKFTSAGDFLKSQEPVKQFIAAMDNSGGSAGGVLDLYDREWDEKNKMERIHEFRLRMMSAPEFTSDNIFGAILYKDSVERGAVDVLDKKCIRSIIKIDEGCEPDGTLKPFDIDGMIQYTLNHGCYGTKMRSVVKSESIMVPIVKQQMMYAEKIAAAGLVPIIEPEVPIDHPSKEKIESDLSIYLESRLTKFQGDCILKVTPPEKPGLYDYFTKLKNVKVVFLSGGYSTKEACKRLSRNSGVSASFSRALSEGLKYPQSDKEFNDVIDSNIRKIVLASG